jgi:hypothetical protein
VDEDSATGPNEVDKPAERAQIHSTTEVTEISFSDNFQFPPRQVRFGEVERYVMVGAATLARRPGGEGVQDGQLKLILAARQSRPQSEPALFATQP